MSETSHKMNRFIVARTKASRPAPEEQTPTPPQSSGFDGGVRRNIVRRSVGMNGLIARSYKSW